MFLILSKQRELFLCHESAEHGGLNNRTTQFIPDAWGSVPDSSAAPTLTPTPRKSQSPLGFYPCNLGCWGLARVRGLQDGFAAHLGLGFVSVPISDVSKFKARGPRDRLHKDRRGWIIRARVVGVGVEKVTFFQMLPASVSCKE